VWHLIALRVICNFLYTVVKVFVAGGVKNSEIMAGEIQKCVKKRPGIFKFRRFWRVRSSELFFFVYKYDKIFRYYGIRYSLFTLSVVVAKFRRVLLSSAIFWIFSYFYDNK
jgi:hypothetical protein